MTKSRLKSNLQSSRISLSIVEYEVEQEFDGSELLNMQVCLEQSQRGIEAILKRVSEKESE